MQTTLQKIIGQISSSGHISHTVYSYPESDGK